MMVEEEVVGTAMGFEHKRRLEGRGLADVNDRPAGMGTYRRVYNLSARQGAGRGQGRGRGGRRWAGEGARAGADD